MTDENCKAASKRDQCEARIDIDEREQARTHRVQMMMLDIDGILTRHEATATDVLAAAQALATSAIGDLTNAVIKREESQVRLDYPEREQGRADRLNKGTDQTDALHKAADAIADQIRAALHKRIDEGKLPDW